MKKALRYVMLAALFAGIVSCEKEENNAIDKNQTLFSKSEVKNFFDNMKASTSKMASSNISSLNNSEIFEFEEDFQTICSGLDIATFDNSPDPFVVAPLGILLDNELSVSLLNQPLANYRIENSSQLYYLAIINPQDGSISKSIGKTDFSPLNIIVDSEINSIGLIINQMGVKQPTTVKFFNNNTLVEELNLSKEAGNYLGVKTENLFNKIVISSINGSIFIDNITIGNCSADADGDGCLDSEDPFPNSNLSETVILADCDTGITNVLTDDCGIYLADIVDALEVQELKNHGQFVSAVAHMAQDWVDAGYITETEKSNMVTCAANSK